jgi:hypothetical protein
MYYPGYSQIQVSDNLLWQEIASISNSFPMIVTTVNNHNYIAGMNVTFLIPVQYGASELNGINVQVLSIPTGTTLSIDFDSTQTSSFAYPNPLPNAFTPATVIPNSSGPYLPPLPLPYANQDSFEGVIYNNGLPSDPINGM